MHYICYISSISAQGWVFTSDSRLWASLWPDYIFWAIYKFSCYFKNNNGISQFQPCQSPRVFTAFPNPGGGAIGKFFSPGVGTSTFSIMAGYNNWQILLGKILKSFANGLSPTISNIRNLA